MAEPGSPRKAVDRVFNVPKEGEEKIRALVQNQREAIRPLEAYEAKKSPELEKNILELNTRLKDFFNTYGVEWKDMPPQAVHLITFETPIPTHILKQFEQGVRGQFQPISQNVWALHPPNETELSLYQTLAHEMIHASAFLSLQKARTLESKAWLSLSKKDNDGTRSDLLLSPRRGGLRVETRENKLLFHDLDEALVEMLAKRFDQSHGFEGLSHRVKFDLKERSRLRSNFPDTEIAHFRYAPKETHTDEKEMVPVFTQPYSYKKERTLLSGILKTVSQKDPKKFPTEDAVFRLFVDGEFNGKLGPLAKAVEATYGKGSFRRLAEWDVEKDGTEFH